VGLFRTEFLYMDSDKVPTEEEQFNAYKEALENMEGKPVIIRTLDIGGDKKLSYLPLEEEMNPFLGYRALRLCLNEKEIFNTQLRALLRASVFGNLKIMFPMVSRFQEIREAKAVLENVKKDLRKENIVYSENIEIGIRREILSAAVISDLLATEVDFFSIGTNDLIQYTIAVDRMNEKVSYLYDPLHPAVLRLIKLVIDNAHNEGKWVGMCGEMAGDLRVIPILIGMGLDEFSMNAPSLLKARKLIRSINFEASKKVAEHVLKIATSEEILEYLNSVDVGI
jgi:phosphoenolpyruvate-protein phosphotransferase (PTS system enzyme I)